MKYRKILAVLLLSAFCLSGCSDKYREAVEKDMKTEQTTTSSSAAEETKESDEKDKEAEDDDSIPMLDMSEEWEISYGCEQYCIGTDILCETYGFTSKSGYQFACSVFLPETAKDGKDCPVILLNNGLQTTWSLQENVFQIKKGAVPDADGNYKEEDLEKTGVKTAQINNIYASYRPETLLAKALNDEGIGLIVIEPFDSLAVYNTFLGVSRQNDGSAAPDQDPKGHSFQINYAVDKAFMDIVLNNIGEITGADPSKVILASRDYHNIAATQLAAQNQDKISGLIMIDPCTGLRDKIRKEYPEKESLKGIEEVKAGMAMDYLYDLYDIDLKEESSKLNVNTKIFISDELKKADTTDPKYDRGLVNDTLASTDSAKEYYPNSAPEELDTTDFTFTSTPSSEQTNSITKIVSFCKMLAKQ